MYLRFRQYITAVVLLLCVLSVAVAQAPLSDPAIEARVEALLKKMTLEEKIGQLNQYSAGMPTGPGTGRTDYEGMIARGQIGSLLNVTGAEKTNAYQKIAVEKSRLKIPILFGLDIIHGYRTIFPVPLGMAATWNPQTVERAARIAAEEGSRAGVRWTFSPMVDIARDARWGRIVEGAGEDTYLGAAIAKAYVSGYQGTRLSDPLSIAACAKHYVGYGAAEGGRDYNTVDIPERTLRNVYLPPFKAAADAGAVTFMSSFNTLDGLPVTANRRVLTDILRREWGFRGLVVSDWGAVGELLPHGVANDGATAARKALTAGVDMDMESNLYTTELPKLVASGAVSQATIDEAVRRVLRVKFALGLFDNPYTPLPATENQPIAPAYLEAARQAAEQSFVLLKNESGANGGPVLPLSAKAKTIALIGPLADSAQDMLGSWFTQGKASDVVTLRQALQSHVQTTGQELLYAKGVEITAPAGPGLAEALDAAKRADVVILAIGEDGGRMSGEAASRAYLDLPGDQQRLFDEVAATGKPVVVVLFSGRPLSITKVAQKATAILQAWFPGVQAGPALVNALYGKVNPSGKLTTSFPRTVGQEPLYYNALNTGRPANPAELNRPPAADSEKFRSRYIDEHNAPLFPFGFGLSYTKFTYSDVKASAATVSATVLNAGKATPLKISAQITNSGDRDGEEVVQLYIGLRGTSIARPVRELRGFQRVRLAGGESKRVEFELGRDELAFWNADLKFQVEPASLSVWVAPNSSEGTPVFLSIQK